MRQKWKMSLFVFTYYQFLFGTDTEEVSDLKAPNSYQIAGIDRRKKSWKERVYERSTSSIYCVINTSETLQSRARTLYPLLLNLHSPLGNPDPLVFSKS